MVVFSKSLIEEYKTEMANTYGLFVSDTDAQIQLLTLVRSMFPTISVVEHEASEAFGSLASAHTEVGAVLPRLRDKNINK